MAAPVDHLSSLPLFSACTPKELQHLTRVVDEVDVAAGTELTTQGDPGHEAFVVMRGTAAVTRDGVEVAQVGEGDHVGELALLDGGPRTATVTAVTDMTLLVMSRPAFNGVLDEVPTLAHKLLVSLARRLRDSERSVGH